MRWKMNKVLVIGAARSGIEVSKLLNKHGYEVYLSDMKAISVKDDLTSQGIKVYDNGHPECLKEIDYDFIVKNPGIPYNVPFVKYFVEKGKEILNEIEVANRYVNYHYGAITGTNGKTTTTTLLSELLKLQYGLRAHAIGNIGTPLSSLVLKEENQEDYVALEISAFQLNACPSFKPKVACIMNLTPDHLDYYDTLDDYYNAKCLIYKNQDENDYFIRNLDDPQIKARCNNLRSQIIDMSLEARYDLYQKDGAIYYKDVFLFNREDLKLVGDHNLQNAMVASCMAYILGVKPELIRQGIKDFKGVEHRIEFVREINGVKYYNDSKGTNVDAGVVALKSFEKPVILLCGGHDKHTGFKEIVPYLNKVKRMYAFGETKYQLKEIYPDCVICEDMNEALTKAHEVAKEKDVVLLCPLCSSYDQFKNFEERGEIFKQLVNKLN